MNETPSQPHGQQRSSESPADGSARIADHAAHAGHAIVDELRILRRSSSDRVVAGVMGGLGVRLGIDPVVLRIVTAVLALFGGAGVLIYAIAWLLVPADDEAGSVLDQALGRVNPRQPNAGPLALGLGLAALISAGFVVSGSVVSGPLLVGAAAAGYLLLRRRDEEAAEHSTSTPVDDGSSSNDLPRSWPSDQPVETVEHGLYAPPEQDEPAEVPESSVIDDDHSDEAAGSESDEMGDADPDPDPSPLTTSSTSDPSANVFSEVSNARGAGWPDGPDWTPPSDTRWAAPDPGEPTPPAKPKHRSPLGPITFSAALVAVGILAIVDASTDFHIGLYFAVPLAIIGLGLVIGSWFGRSGWLIALGIVLALALPVATWADEFNGEWGAQRHHEIATLGAFPPEPVDIGAGQVTYDLANLDLDPDDVGTLSIEMGLGDLTILVPREADLDIDASLGAGDIVVRSAQSSGVGSDISQKFDGVGADGGTIELNIDMGLGSVKVVNR